MKKTTEGIRTEQKRIKKRHNGKTGRIKTILRRLLLIGCGAFLGTNLYLVNANRLAGDQLPMPLGYGAAIVTSGSMEPAISIDDMLLVHKADEYEVGDVIIFQEENMLVAHRVMKTEGDTLITKGDANNVEDPAIHLSAVKGKVIFMIPSAGIVVRSLQTPGIAFVILLLAVLLIELSYRREQKKDMEDMDELRKEIRRMKEE